MRCLFTMFLLTLTVTFPAGTVAQQAELQQVLDRIRLHRTLQQCPELMELMAHPDWQEDLANPAFGANVSLKHFVWSVRVIRAFLDDLQRQLETGVLPSFKTLPDQLEEIHYMTGQLQAFLATPISQLSFRTSTDLAIRTLRDEAGLSPPEGDVLLVRYLTPRTVPEELARVVKDPNTLGATLYCRYIVMLEFVFVGLEAVPVPRPTVVRSVSHELAHAYINSFLGLRRVDDLPKWFHEGVAIYVSSSDRSPTSKPSKEYQEYAKGFRFLQKKLGRQRLIRLIGLSVRTVSTDSLLASVGATSFPGLLEIAKREHWRWWMRTGLYGGGTLVLLIVLDELVASRRRRRPQLYVHLIADRQVSVFVKGCKKEAALRVLSDDRVFMTAYLQNPSKPSVIELLDNNGRRLPPGLYTIEVLAIDGLQIQQDLELT